MKEMLVLTYEVMETCQNGRERKLTRNVYTEAPKNVDEFKEKVEKGKEALKKKYYYNINLVKASTTKDLFI